MADKERMLRWIVKTVGVVALMVAGSFGIWFYQDHFSARHEIQKLEEQKRVLQQVVQRLSDEKRVAEVLVTDQRTVEGVLHSSLLLVEYDKSGRTLPPRRFEVIGEMVHIDALVIKFDRQFVKEGDGLRGHSIALFTKIYGDRQSPSEAYPIDEPGKIPAVYRGADPKVSEFELKLWADFWKLADDAAYRQREGVRVANGQGVWGPFERGRLYTITLESDGGLNLTSEPVKGIYREAMKGT